MSYKGIPRLLDSTCSSTPEFWSCLDSRGASRVATVFVMVGEKIKTKAGTDWARDAVSLMCPVQVNRDGEDKRRGTTT